MKSNDEFVVSRKYKTSHGSEGLCVGFALEGLPILQFSESSVRIVTDIDRWEEVKEPREFWVVGAFAYRFKAVATARANQFSPPLDIIHVREVV